MAGNRQRLGKKVRDVAEAAEELDTEVSLADAVPDPVQAHVRGLGHALRDGVGGDVDGHLVVTKEGGGWLGAVAFLVLVVVVVVVLAPLTGAVAFLVLVVVVVVLAPLPVARAPLALLVGADHHLHTGRPADAARPVSRGSFRRSRSSLSCSSS